MAHSLAIGGVVSIFPVWGTTVAISIALIFFLRLHATAVMVANLLTYPLQIARIVPYIFLGAILFGGQGADGITLEVLNQKYSEGVLTFFLEFGHWLLRASLAWLVTAPAWYFVFRGIAGVLLRWIPLVDKRP